jgi:hypothetical protein
VPANSTNLHIGTGPIIPMPRETISLAIDFDGTILWNGTVVQDLAQLERKEHRQYPGVLAARPA